MKDLLPIFPVIAQLPEFGAIKLHLLTKLYNDAQKRIAVNKK
jgi:hypothetical protein